MEDEISIRVKPAADESERGYEPGVAFPALRPRPPFVEQFPGVVRSSPCSTNGADYGDARYSIQRATPRNGISSSDSLATDPETLPGIPPCITATNLAELPCGTHLLSPGTTVQVFGLYARTGGKVYVFNYPPPGAVAVKITGNATGAGEYNGRVLGGASSATAGAALVMPAGMGVGPADDALILNEEESGLPGHRLAAGSFAVGVLRGRTGDVPPRSIVVILGGVGRTDGPTVLGDGSEGSETADTSSWSTAGSATPVSLSVVCRTVYNDAGDQALYSFVRSLSFDARGLLLSVGPESRVTVDATEACP